MATDLATYYLNVVPSAKGMGGNLVSELEGAGGDAGTKAGNKFAAMFRKAVTVLSIGKIFSDAIKEGAALEQSFGGIETMFKDSADKMKQYAAQAYATAGVSANEYMEQVTSFSARLMQVVGNDTDLAADIANRAMIDMSDNANKFGTDIASIQNAYQGFAKENYTMLDNLKLGYGGTKSEMERLIQDAAKMTEEQSKLGVTVDANSMSFDNIINAISVMQEHLDVAGTTQTEALSTYSGSFKAMESAWKNVVGYVATGSPEVGSAVQGLAESVGAYIGQASEMIINIAESLPGAIVSLIEQAGPDLLDSGISLIINLAEGLIESIPNMLGKIPTLITALTTGINKYWPQLIKVGTDLIINLGKGLINALPSILNTIPGLAKSLLSALTTSLLGVVEIGKNLVQGLWNGISNMTSWVLSKIKGFGNSVLNGLKKFFGIHSPSTLFRDEIGKNLALGVGEGFEKYIPVDSMSNALNDAAMDSLNSIDPAFAVSAAMNDINADYGSGSMSTTNYGGVAINVYATDGQSARSIAEEVMEIMQNQVNSQRLVFR